MNPRFGLNGATTGRTDLATDLRLAREAGFGALEIRDTKLEEYLRRGGTLPALRGDFAEAGVTPLSLNALERSTLAEGAEREAVLARCRTLCAWSAALGCPYVIAVPSFLDGDFGTARVRTLTVAALRAMAAIGRSSGVRIGFEFLGFPTCSVHTLGAARAIVEEVADPAVGLVLDAFHFYAGGSTSAMLDGLDPRLLFIVHLDDAEAGPREALTDGQRLLPGAGVIPLTDLVGRLEALGYRGVYSVELFRPEYWTWEPRQLVRAAWESLKTLLAGIEAKEPTA